MHASTHHPVLCSLLHDVGKWQQQLLDLALGSLCVTWYVILPWSLSGLHSLDFLQFSMTFSSSVCVEGGRREGGDLRECPALHRWPDECTEACDHLLRENYDHLLIEACAHFPIKAYAHISKEACVNLPIEDCAHLSREACVHLLRGSCVNLLREDCIHLLIEAYAHLPIDRNLISIRKSSI